MVKDSCRKTLSIFFIEINDGLVPATKIFRSSQLTFSALALAVIGKKLKQNWSKRKL
jgi:hypothetical protein